MASIDIGFIGCGQMAQALAQGFVNGKLHKAENIILSDAYAPQLESMKKHGYQTTMSNADVVQKAKIIILAVKPNMVQAVMKDVQANWEHSKVLVSICAGINLTTLLSHLPERSSVVRVMPNTPCLVGKGASCYAVSPGCSNETSKLVGELLGSVGTAYAVAESSLDAVTGLSGSGPAFVYMMIEAMADGGVKGGLTRDVALGLAAQTVYGSAAMVLESGKHPAVLKDQVTSPGGTTIAGVAALERNSFRSAVIDAVDCATRRAVEMSTM